MPAQAWQRRDSTWWSGYQAHVKVLLLARYSAFGREEKSSPGVLAFYFAERYLYSSCSTTYSTCTYTTCTSLTCTHLSTAIHTLL